MAARTRAPVRCPGDLRGRTDVRARFWSHQAIHLLATGVFLLVGISIWFDQPARIAASAGLITAGLAVALQRVITLGYTRTTILEMPAAARAGG